MMIMNKLLFSYNDILVEEPRLPVDFGETQAQKDLNQFKENLIHVFNNNDCEEYNEFLEELEELHVKIESGDLSDFTELKL